MRRIRLWAAAVCILALLVAGCGAGKVAQTPDTGSSPGLGDGALAELPDAVAAIAETLRPLHAGTAVVEGNKTYLIVSDAQPAAGYGVEITDIETEGDRAVATVGIIEPDPDAIPAEMAAHPYAVQALDGVYTEVRFQHADGEYFPRVVGLNEPFQLAERSENILAGPVEWAGARVRARGLARVFEATVSYELRNENGEILERDFTTAAAGGPDWGYFEVSIDNPAADATHLRLFQESARDGSPLDVVQLPLEKCG